MKPLAWFSAGFGTAVGLLLTAAVVVDVVFVEDHLPTLSRRTIDAANHFPAIAAGISGVLSLVVGLLLGHLFFGQIVYSTDSIEGPVKS